MKMRSRYLLAAITATSFAAALVGLVPARAQVQEPVLTAAQREKAPLTLPAWLMQRRSLAEALTDH